MADVTAVIDRIKQQEQKRYLSSQRHRLSKALEHLDQISSAAIIDDVIPIRIKLVDLLHRLDALEGG